MRAGGDARREALCDRLYGETETVAVEVQTFAQAIEAVESVASTGTIALLKVDVEGAELEVLQGVGAGWWQRIERVVVEVHDVANRRHDVDSLLRKEAGFAEVACGQP